MLTPQLSAVSLLIIFALALGLLSCRRGNETASSTGNPIQIPKITGAGADPSAWAKQAHQVLILSPLGDAAGSKAELSFAWTPSALLLQIRSDDTTPVEVRDQLWSGDSVELFVSSAYGSKDRLQYIFCAGRTPENPTPRWHAYNDSVILPMRVDPEIHAQSDAKGYVMTLSVPWANLDHVPQPGDIIGLQVYVNDAQGSARNSCRTWFPGHGANTDALQMQRVQLADRADSPEIAAAQLQPKGFRDLAVCVYAPAEFSGKKIEVSSSGKQVASGKLVASVSDGCAAEILLPRSLVQHPQAPVIVSVDGQPVPAVLKAPDLTQRPVDLLKRQRLAAVPSVFDGATFPKIDFLDKELVEAAVGSYTLHPRFFDAKWNEVTAPTAPGRYGALVEFRSQDGITFTRHLTLFKTAHPYFSPKDPYGVAVKFPAAFGLPVNAMLEEEWNISDWLGRRLENLGRQDGSQAVLLAGLADIAADPARWRGFNIWRIEGAWWAGLQKQLGEARDYQRLVHLPEGYDKDKKAWPLILFLHGSGQRGNNLDAIKNEGPLGYINKGHPIPFIVVSALCPENEWWNPEQLAHLLDEISSTYRVDPKRIYLTGLSMGGDGTWDLAATYPEKFAAIAPVAGEENPGIAERLKKMPTWIFHGSEDDIVFTRYSIGVADAMRKLGAPVKLTIHPGVGHGGWELAYHNPELYAWFLQHSR